MVWANEKEPVSVWYGANLHQTCQSHAPAQNATLQLRPARRHRLATASQWQLTGPLFNWQRQRKYDLRRDILDAIFYLVKTGCQWRMLPETFAPWTTVYFYFRQWKQSGLLERLHDSLRRL